MNDEKRKNEILSKIKTIKNSKQVDPVFKSWLDQVKQYIIERLK